MNKPEIEPTLLLTVFRRLLADGGAVEPTEPIAATMQATSLVTRAMTFLDQHGAQLLTLAEAGARRANTDAETTRLLTSAARGLSSVDDLIASSHGVAGLHMNGDVAPWPDLTDGAFSEWLGDFAQACADMRVAGMWPSPAPATEPKKEAANGTAQD